MDRCEDQLKIYRGRSNDLPGSLLQTSTTGPDLRDQQKRHEAIMSEDVVWNSTLDGRFTVTVVRTEPYRGTLSIHEEDQLLHSEGVALAFDALFGPDIDDVDEWQQIAMEFVDKLKSSKG